MGGSSGGSDSTPQQKQLETNQALQQARLDQQENERRKRLLQATQGLRVFRGSALSTPLGTNARAGAPAGGGGSPGLFRGLGGSLIPGAGAGGGAGPGGGGALVR